MTDQQRKTFSLTRFPRTPQAVRNGPLASTVGMARARMARAALQWRDLAERRREHFTDLYESGRWRHYYTDREFLDEMRNAVANAQRWSKIALRSEELAAPAVVELPRPKAAA